MRKLIISPQSVEDLEEIWAYISRDNPDAADNIIRKIYDKFSDLCEDPALGIRRPNIPDKFLSYLLRPYLIVYAVTTDAVVITTIVHGARDLEALFGADQ